MTFEVSHTDYQRLTKDIRLFLEAWKRLKGYTTETLDFQQSIELLRALTHSTKLYDAGIKDSVYELDSFLFAHDGDEPLDVVWDELVHALRRKLYLKKIELI